MNVSPILVTLKTAALAIFITFFLGIFFAFFVMKIKNEKLRAAIDSLLILPLVLPPTVVGFILLYIFGTGRPLGAFFLEFFKVRIVFSWWAVVLAAVIMSFPLMYRSARGAFQAVDENIIYAAQTLGISQVRIFWRVLLPCAKEGIISGGVLAFARAIGEFGATAMIAGNIEGRTRTLPIAIYSAVMAGNMEEASKYVFIILILSAVIMIYINRLPYLESLALKRRRK